VSATDADTEERADIVYSLEFPWTGVDGFQVDAETGVITAVKSFNREEEAGAGALRFLVVATDRGRPLTRSASATAVVRVIDVNDESPVFVDVAPSGGYELRVVENVPPGTVVGRVEARDADHGRNAVVSYALSSSPQDDDQLVAPPAFQSFIATFSPSHAASLPQAVSRLAPRLRVSVSVHTTRVHGPTQGRNHVF